MLTAHEAAAITLKANKETVNTIIIQEASQGYTVAYVFKNRISKEVEEELIASGYTVTKTNANNMIEISW